MASVRQSLWLKEYAARLTRTNTFYFGAKNDSNEIRQAGTITIPQSTGLPTVSILNDATSLPVAGAKATFDYLEYSPSTYKFDPMFIHNLDEVELSFDAMSEKLNECTKALQEKLDFHIAYNWTVASTGNVIDTTGEKTRQNIFGNASAKAITLADIVKANIELNKQNVPTVGRRLLVDPVGYGDLVQLKEFIDPSVTDRTTIIEGFVGRIMGFDVYMTSKLGSFVSGGTKKAIDAVDANTDRSCAIAYHPGYVRYGIGTKNSGGLGIKFTDAPGYFTEGQLFEGWARVAAIPTYKAVNDVIVGVVTIREGV